MAQASLAVLETQLEIPVRLTYVQTPEATPVFDQAAVLGKQLFALRNALDKRV